jgi:2-amino-4-hydroxy-6-hydroxymethyldihydropteridine diphosphokinase
MKAAVILRNRSMSRALVAIGCNLGDRARQLDSAVARLRATPGIAVIAASRWHETAPVGGPTGQGAFLNGALLLDTSLSPEPLRQALTRVESELGRRRDVRWQARLLDLDLLLYDQLVLATRDLIVPHPRMAFRRFVLDPAAEIAPDMVHPLLGWRIDELARHLHDSRPYVALLGIPGVGKTRLAARLAEKFPGQAILLPPQLASSLKPPASPGLDREIQFLHGMAQLLAVGYFPAGDQLAISDFWFGQTLAYAKMRLPTSELKPFDEIESRLAATIVAPRLRVLLTTSLPPSTGPRDKTGGLDLGALQDALCEVALRPGGGPILQLSALDEQNVLEEVVAAIEAMR